MVQPRVEARRGGDGAHQVRVGVWWSGGGGIGDNQPLVDHGESLVVLCASGMEPMALSEGQS